MNKPLDFFGNEIEVGDEVAYYSDVDRALALGVITEVKHIETYRNVVIDDFAAYPPEWVLVNTEKKHREKALDYLAAEAQDLGMYDEAVGITTLREGFE